MTVQSARKLIAEAEQALKRTENYFRTNGIDPDSLQAELEQKHGPEVCREIDMMVQAALEKVQQDANEALREAQKSSVIPAVKHRLRQMI